MPSPTGGVDRGDEKWSQARAFIAWAEHKLFRVLSFGEKRACKKSREQRERESLFALISCLFPYFFFVSSLFRFSTKNSPLFRPSLLFTPRGLLPLEAAPRATPANRARRRLLLLLVGEARGRLQRPRARRYPGSLRRRRRRPPPGPRGGRGPCGPRGRRRLLLVLLLLLLLLLRGSWPSPRLPPRPSERTPPPPRRAPWRRRRPTGATPRSP